MCVAWEVVRCSCPEILEKTMVWFQPELIQYFSGEDILFCWFHGSIKNEYLGLAGGPATLHGLPQLWFTAPFLSCL